MDDPTTALQERIARILNDEGWTFESVHEPGDYDECEECRLTVAPIAARIAGEITAEVRAASEKAWDEGHNTRRTVEKGGWHLNPYRATEYETGDQT